MYNTYNLIKTFTSEEEQYKMELKERRMRQIFREEMLHFIPESTRQEIMEREYAYKLNREELNNPVISEIKEYFNKGAADWLIAIAMWEYDNQNYLSHEEKKEIMKAVKPDSLGEIIKRW